MNNKRAEEEVSALITGIMLLGVAAPTALIWAAGRFSALVEYLVSFGVLESSERVIWNVAGDAGIDTGRMLIILGFSVLCGVFLYSIARIVVLGKNKN